jgi:hypothetical protein
MFEMFGYTATFHFRGAAILLKKLIVFPHHISSLNVQNTQNFILGVWKLTDKGSIWGVRWR